MSGEREINNAWATWLAQRMRAVGLPTPSDLARAAGGQPDQSVVSRWLNEGRTPTIDLLRRIEGPLRTPLLELMVRAGHITTAEAKMTRQLDVHVEVPEAIETDPNLIREAKEHLLNQYELLLRVAPDPSPSVARGKKSPRRTATPSDEPPLRAVARGGDPAHREEVSRMARRVREEHDHGEGTGKKK